MKDQCRWERGRVKREGLLTGDDEESCKAGGRHGEGRVVCCFQRVELRKVSRWVLDCSKGRVSCFVFRGVGRSQIMGGVPSQVSSFKRHSEMIKDQIKGSRKRRLASLQFRPDE